MRRDPAARNIVQRLPWMRHAACRNTDPNLFFPERGKSQTEAKTICNTCPVKQACLDYAIDSGTEYGTWGGMTSKDRDLYQRQRNRQRRTSRE